MLVIGVILKVSTGGMFPGGIVARPGHSHNSSLGSFPAQGTNQNKRKQKKTK